MPLQRRHLVVNTGNLLELAGVAVGCYAAALLAGVAWALVALAVALLVGAELAYDGHSLRIALPRWPHPVQRTHRALSVLRLRARSRLRRLRRRRLKDQPILNMEALERWAEAQGST